MISLFPACAKSGQYLVTGSVRSIARCCKTWRRQALPKPLVADHKRAIVSFVHDTSRVASRNPPCSSRIDLPFCQTETAAPSSPKQVKFSSKSEESRSKFTREGKLRIKETKEGRFVIARISRWAITNRPPCLLEIAK